MVQRSLSFNHNKTRSDILKDGSQAGWRAERKRLAPVEIQRRSRSLGCGQNFKFFLCQFFYDIFTHNESNWEKIRGLYSYLSPGKIKFDEICEMKKIKCNFQEAI